MPNSDDDPPQRHHQVDTGEFFFPGDGLSALLIHGCSGTPYEMRFLGERMNAAGARVLGIKLAGHAGAPEELGASTHQQWYQSSVDGLQRLLEFPDPVVVIGQSMGAVLAC